MYDKTVIALLFSSVILYDDYMKNKKLNITITVKIGNCIFEEKVKDIFHRGILKNFERIYEILNKESIDIISISGYSDDYCERMLLFFEKISQCKKQEDVPLIVNNLLLVSPA